MKRSCEPADGAQAVGHLDGAGDAGAEADAVIGARHIVVHGLGDCDDLDALAVQPHAVAQGVVAADGDQVIDAQPVQVLQDFGRQIVDVLFIGILQMRGHASFFTWLGLVREVCKKVPPVRPARLTTSSVRTWNCCCCRPFRRG